MSDPATTSEAKLVVRPGSPGFPVEYERSLGDVTPDAAAPTLSRDPAMRRLVSGAGRGPWLPPTTAAAWLLATYSLPVCLIAAIGGALLAARGHHTLAMFAPPAVLLVAWLVSLTTASKDQLTLRRRGYRNVPGPGWLLLITPVVFLAVRATRLRGQGAHNLSAVFAQLVVSIAVAFASAAVLVVTVIDQYQRLK